jgi:uncharacterized membrane-anchored protein
MKTNTATVLALGLIALLQTGRAQDYVTNRAQAVRFVEGLKYQHGEIDLPGGLAKLNVPAEFKFLDRNDAEAVLVKLWHNPPSTDSIGMLLPADKSPLDEDCWAVTISYADDGYVKDDDAAKINYDDLLKKMQAAARESSAKRVEQGYPSIELVGWAAPPRYDAQTHKLYWAKEIKFGDSPDNTLNYNIRILGRRGVLVLNVIAGINQLCQVEASAPQILAMVNFNQGNRYSDFDPKIDKVATYGIAALVAGGIAAKLGFFKLLWVFILAAKKFIIIGFVAVVAWLKRLFGRGKSTTPSA